MLERLAQAIEDDEDRPVTLVAQANSEKRGSARFNPKVLADVPVGPIFTVAHGAGNGVMTIARGTIPLHLFGPAGYGGRQGLLMLPGRFVQAAAPLIFDALFSVMGAAALTATAACSLGSLALLTVLRRFSERR